MTAGIDGAELSGFLDWYRAVAAKKLDGLTREQAVAVEMPSGTTMLGIVSHLRWAEHLWFQHYFLGGEHGADIEESFVAGPGLGVAEVVAAYEAECVRSRAVVADAPSLAAPAAVQHRIWGRVTVGWIVVHLIEETARHCGHLDILRELTDGRTGD
jgi:hypothetical protein